MVQTVFTCRVGSWSGVIFGVDFISLSKVKQVKGGKLCKHIKLDWGNKQHIMFNKASIIFECYSPGCGFCPGAPRGDRSSGWQARPRGGQSLGPSPPPSDPPKSESAWCAQTASLRRTNAAWLNTRSPGREEISWCTRTEIVHLDT